MLLAIAVDILHAQRNHFRTCHTQLAVRSWYYH
jgi:hypothetical protein